MEELISPKELSKLLKVSKTWPYKMAKRGRLPCYRLEGVIRFKRVDIEAYLERSRSEKK
jgi:excisionase family DNA binding protein